MGRVQMLHQHKRHPGTIGEALHQPRTRREPAGRSANSHNKEVSLCNSIYADLAAGSITAKRIFRGWFGRLRHGLNLSPSVAAAPAHMEPYHVLQRLLCRICRFKSPAYSRSQL